MHIMCSMKYPSEMCPGLITVLHFSKTYILFANVARGHSRKSVKSLLSFVLLNLNSQDNLVSETCSAL
jgi:hypothetical protein